jgi:hypothetical protein
MKLKQPVKQQPYYGNLVQAIGVAGDALLTKFHPNN